MVEKLLNLLDSLEAKDHKFLDSIHALNVESDCLLTGESGKTDCLRIRRKR